jgi:hypothetical protein
MVFESVVESGRGHFEAGRNAKRRQKTVSEAKASTVPVFHGAGQFS